MKTWLKQLMCTHSWSKRTHWYRKDCTTYKKCRVCGKAKIIK